MEFRELRLEHSGARYFKGVLWLRDADLPVGSFEYFVFYSSLTADGDSQP